MNPSHPNPSQVLSQLSSARLPRPNIGTPYVAARDPIEKGLCSFWCEILKLSEIGIEDNFFSLGGDSVQMAQIIARIDKGFNAEITFGDFFDHPTVESLANIIRTKLSAKNT